MQQQAIVYSIIDCGLQQRPRAGVSGSGMTRTDQSPLWPGAPMALAAAVLFGITVRVYRNDYGDSLQDCPLAPRKLGPKPRGEPDTARQGQLL
jgi:hypothetical protein